MGYTWSRECTVCCEQLGAGEKETKRFPRIVSDFQVLEWYYTLSA